MANLFSNFLDNVRSVAEYVMLEVRIGASRENLLERVPLKYEE